MTAMRSIVLCLSATVAVGVAPSMATAATGISGATPTPTAAATPPPTPVPTPTPIPSGPGVYHVWSCRLPSGAPAEADGWSADEVTPPSAVLAGCSSGGGVGISTDAITNNGGTLRWSPATGLTALSVRLWRSASATVNKLYLDGGGADAGLVAVGGTLAGNVVTTKQTTIDNLDANFSYSASAGLAASPTGAGNAVTIDPLPQGVQDRVAPLELHAICRGLRLTYTCQANYTIWRADFRMLDSAAPTGAVTGSLAAALGRPATQVRGPLDLSFTARDAGSGVLDATVEVDGRTVATLAPAGVQRTCAPSDGGDGRPAYTLQRPCPAEAIGAGTIDTAAFSDGRHTVRVVAHDAAGNATELAAGSLLVAGAATVGLGSPTELRGAPNGSPASDSATLRVFWPQTARTASTRASVVRRCKSASYAGKHPVRCQGRPAGVEVARDWSAAGALSGGLQLTTADGQPIAGAKVQLVTVLSAAGAAATPLGEVTTGSDGSAVFSTPVAAGSRTIEARWRARELDTAVAATGSATITVAASTSLAAPARVRPGARITFDGRLDGRSGTLGQVPVRLEVRSGGVWKVFATASTDNDGQWSTSLRFARTPGRYAVRAKVGTSPRTRTPPARASGPSRSPSADQDAGLRLRSGAAGGCDDRRRDGIRRVAVRQVAGVGAQVLRLREEPAGAAGLRPRWQEQIAVAPGDGHRDGRWDGRCLGEAVVGEPLEAVAEGAGAPEGVDVGLRLAGRQVGGTLDELREEQPASTRAPERGADDGPGDARHAADEAEARLAPAHSGRTQNPAGENAVADRTSPRRASSRAIPPPIELPATCGRSRPCSVMNPANAST